MSIKLVISDLDGTLIGYDKDFNFVWDDESLQAINNLKSKNIYFSIATGRHYVDVLEILKQLKIDALKPMFIVGMNGLQIYNYDSKELVFNRYLDKDYANKAIDFYEKYHADASSEVIAFLYCENNIMQIVRKPTQDFIDAYKRVTKWENNNNVFDCQVVDKLSRDLKIYKFALLYNTKLSLDNQEVNELRKMEPALDFVVTGRHSIEIFSQENDKGTGVAFIKNYFKFDPSEILVLGDADNDIAMFEKNTHSATRCCSESKVLELATKTFEGGPSSFVKHAIKHFVK